ncbi:MAG: peptidase domain-containing ABC transporter [Niastella sp.]|nr:peptidase domain-containing ABC transporter [Niastella sp.]
MFSFPFYKQLDRMDCGPTCLRMICKYYGKVFPLETLKRRCYTSRTGVSLWNLSNGATDMGFRTLYARVSFEELQDAQMPCIVHWDRHHFIVVYKIKKNKVIVGDPSIGILTYQVDEFMKKWSNHEQLGIVLLLEPTPAFFMNEEEKGKYIGFRFFFHYLLPFKKYYFQLFLAMVTGFGFSLILPFLTQSVIDIGISNKNIGFINLVLMAQLAFSISGTVMRFVQSWIFLHMGARINIAIVSDYLIKLLKLPMSFFESRMTGDLMQRISDHSRVNAFVSSNTLSLLFSFVNLFVFSFIMCYYSVKILLIFVFFSIIYALWVLVFLKKRKEFDYKFFERSSLRQTNLIQLLHGIRDIKLHNYEDQKRWEWERIQTQTFKISLKQLVISQYQQGGAFFIETTKGILISYLSARAVIDGQMTMGMMMSMQYILAQIGAPISHFTGLINSYQDAKISLERIGEIHMVENEGKKDEFALGGLPASKNLAFDKVSFSYSGAPDQLVLKNVSFKIPEGKVTAIVGESGSGKTTILKLLLKFYPPTKGRILVGSIDLESINHRAWRGDCGAVLQDGFIFSDTLAENIALGDADISLDKLEHAAGIANIDAFIKELPYAYNSKIGTDGIGLSQGQKQRILISRAIYKDPTFIFFDEATNSLDAKNEGEILDKLDSFFRKKTVVVVAHRLSTIRNADQIIVLDNGEVAEIGNHSTLMANRSIYYNLIKKQTEILN